jgi:hypothetical protein
MPNDLEQYISDLKTLQKKLEPMQKIIGDPPEAGPPIIFGKPGLQRAIFSARNECGRIIEILEDPAKAIKDMSRREVVQFVNCKRFCLSIYGLERAMKDPAFNPFNDDDKTLLYNLRKEISELHPGTLGGEIMQRVGNVVADQFPKSSTTRKECLALIYADSDQHDDDIPNEDLPDQQIPF